VRAAAPAAGTSDLLAAFLGGAGMEGAAVADPAATMVALGTAFRELVSGLRQALMARAAVKGEFRIEQTMIRARGNNPLKFSANDDDALGALLGSGRRVDMAPGEAVADALRDMRLHELASAAAMQAAVRSLVARLDPAPLRAEGEKAGGVLPAQKRARAFELYEKLHATVTQGLTDDFDSVFGKAFAHAYEEALRDADERKRN
jgi:type VI secretion system FHA domain protein